MTTLNGIPAPPKAVGASGCRLWKAVLDEYELAPSELAVLEAACLAYQRLGDGQALLDRDGLVIEGRSGLQAHPACAVVRDATTLLARCLRQLDVALADDLPRPSAGKAKPGPKPRPGRPQRLRNVG